MCDRLGRRRGVVAPTSVLLEGLHRATDVHRAQREKILVFRGRPCRRSERHRREQPSKHHLSTFCQICFFNSAKEHPREQDGRSVALLSGGIPGGKRVSAGNEAVQCCSVADGICCRGRWARACAAAPGVPSAAAAAAGRVGTGAARRCAPGLWRRRRRRRWRGAAARARAVPRDGALRPVPAEERGDGRAQG